MILIGLNISDLKIKINLLKLFVPQIFHMEKLGSKYLPPMSTVRIKQGKYVKVLYAVRYMRHSVNISLLY